MNNEQEIKWREEFEAYYLLDHDGDESFYRESYEYVNIYQNDKVQIAWCCYIAARKKAQEEIDLLKDHQRNNCHWKSVALRQHREIQGLKEDIQKRDKFFERVKNEPNKFFWDRDVAEQWIKDLEELKNGK